MNVKSTVFETLYRHINVATMAGGGSAYGAITEAAIGVSGGRIAFVGPMSDIPADVDVQEAVDCNGEWVLPGFIDCHTHLVFGGTRAGEFEDRLKGRSYADIAAEGGGIASTVRATREAPLEALTEATAKRLKCLALEGVTTVEIKSGYGLSLEAEMKMLKAAREAGKRAGVDVQTTLLAAHALPPEFKGNSDAYIDHVCTKIIPAVANHKLADAVDGYCEHIAFSPEQISRVFSAAKRHGLRVKLHADQLSDLGGAELAARHKALSADHIEYANEAGIQAMSEVGTVAVLLPGAFYALSETKKPPVDLLRHYNVPMALATDANPGTSPCLSLQLMLNMGCVLFGLTPEEALAGITRNAAKALDLDGDRGTVEVGKKADLLFFDINHPAELSYWIGGRKPVEVILS